MQSRSHISVGVNPPAHDFFSMLVSDGGHRSACSWFLTRRPGYCFCVSTRPEVDEYASVQSPFHLPPVSLGPKKDTRTRCFAGIDSRCPLRGHSLLWQAATWSLCWTRHISSSGARLLFRPTTNPVGGAPISESVWAVYVILLRGLLNRGTVTRKQFLLRSPFPFVPSPQTLCV